MADLTVSVPEAAKRLGCSKNRAYEMVREGRLRSIDFNGRLRVPVVELNAFIEREMQRSAS